MNYEHIDADEQTAAYLAEQAMKADLEAFQAGFDARRLARLAESSSSEGLRQHAARAHAKAGGDVEAKTRKASILFDKADAVDDAAVASGRRRWLAGYLENLEREHLGHANALAVLEAVGDPGEEAEAHRQAMEVIDGAHELAGEELAALPAPEQKAQSEKPPRGQRAK